MKVLFITQIVDKGHENLGAFHEWIAALAGEAEWVHVLTLATGEVDLPPNVSVHSLGKDRGDGKLRQLRTFHEVVGRLALRREVDVFFAHMVPRYALLLAPYRLIRGIPTVMWYAHNSADLRLKLANLCVDRFVTVSRDSFPLGLAKCDVVGHGVDTELFRPATAPRDESRGIGPDARTGMDARPARAAGDKPLPYGSPWDGCAPVRFLSLARISHRKDQGLLVSAAELLVNRWGHRKVEFVVAGGPLVAEDEAYYERLKARVRELGLEGFFRFTGSVPHSEAVHLVRGSDFFVNMHVEGGLGKAVLEAMSCGKPSFVSTPTYYESFPDHAQTFVFAPRDHEDLARKMLSALRMPREERERVGQELREWVVREHDVRRQMSRIARVLRTASGGGRPSTSA